MFRRYFELGRLQRKVLLVVSVIVVVPMLVAGWLASEWVSTSFERRLEQWIVDAARGNQNWLQAYQNDAVMLGRVLADDSAYVAAVRTRPEESIPASVRRISQELGINLIQLYTPDRKLVYSSVPVEVSTLWEPGQTEAVLKVVRRQKSMLAAVGITPIPRQGTPSYYLVLGSLLGQDFTDELSQLTGLKTRLYYRDGKNYYDLFSNPDDAVVLKHLSATVLARIDKDKKPYYSSNAESGKFRGLYMPIVDSSGHVEAIMFSGIEKRGFQEVLTNRIALFLLIALLGVVIGFATGLILSRMVVRPLAYLRDGVMQLAGQNFNAAVPIQSDDELGDLAKAFNAMATRLREARDEQAQRFQKDKLAALGELSAALAHEIRNPIGVINTSAALLEKSIADPAKTTELTRMIREESVRVSNLVQDFLQLSRHRQPVFEVIDPTAPLERAVGMAVAGRDNIKAHKAFAHGMANIRADAGLLQQAWGNLCTNALQAMGSGGGELWLSARVENGFTCLTLEDSGPGVPAEIMPRLFEPFFTTKEGGTGLGLSIAYTLVEANGGRLEALPPSGRGARFVMRFSITEPS
ncbi:MAG: HAMP domain-containing protein [Gammaproteobacteria bacterium]|nr:HAMP domain-containing protein [Gammaproteobacteria bacterium]